MIFGCIIFSYRYDLTKCTWDDSLTLLTLITAHHRMRLTTASLTIGKYGAIIAI